MPAPMFLPGPGPLLHPQQGINIPTPVVSAVTVKQLAAMGVG